MQYSSPTNILIIQYGSPGNNILARFLVRAPIAEKTFFEKMQKVCLNLHIDMCAYLWILISTVYVLYVSSLYGVSRTDSTFAGRQSCIVICSLVHQLVHVWHSALIFWLLVAAALAPHSCSTRSGHTLVTASIGGQNLDEGSR